jgi:hypothetical protein
VVYLLLLALFWTSTTLSDKRKFENWIIADTVGIDLSIAWLLEEVLLDTVNLTSEVVFTTRCN